MGADLNTVCIAGDIGEMTSESNLRVIDRKKNIFKLAQGEFVAPEWLENLYVNSSPLVSQMYIYGNSLQTNVIAVVIPHEESLRHHRGEGGGERADPSPAGVVWYIMMQSHSL